jgi:hypothetical protein
MNPMDVIHGLGLLLLPGCLAGIGYLTARDPGLRPITWIYDRWETGARWLICASLVPMLSLALWVRVWARTDGSRWPVLVPTFGAAAFIAAAMYWGRRQRLSALREYERRRLAEKFRQVEAQLAVTLNEARQGKHELAEKRQRLEAVETDLATHKKAEANRKRNEDEKVAVLKAREVAGQKLAQDWSHQEWRGRTLELASTVDIQTRGQVGRNATVAELLRSLHGWDIAEIEAVAERLKNKGWAELEYELPLVLGAAVPSAGHNVRLIALDPSIYTSPAPVTLMGAPKYIERTYEDMMRASVHPPTRSGLGVTHIRLTKEGMKVVEQSESAKPAVSLGDHNRILIGLINTGQTGAVNLGQHSGNVTQTPFSAEMDDFASGMRDWINDFRAALDEEEVEEKIRQRARVNLETLELQLSVQPIEESVVGSTLVVLREILYGLAGNAAFMALLSLLPGK